MKCKLAFNFSKSTKIKSSSFNDKYFKFKKDEEGRIIVDKKSTIKEIFESQRDYTYLPKLTIRMKNGNADKLFSDLIYLKRIEGLETSEVKSMSGIFARCRELLELPSDMDTSNVEDMSDAFMGCKKMKKLPNLNTKKVRNMSRMCYDMKSLESFGGFDTSSVSNMESMFERNNNLEEVNGLDTSNVTNIKQIFFGCMKLKNVTKLNTKKLKKKGTESSFYKCKSLNYETKNWIKKDKKLVDSFSPVNFSLVDEEYSHSIVELKNFFDNLL